jgi:hypothetical protein
MKETIAGRAIDILYADGSDAKAIKKLVDAVKKQGGRSVLVSIDPSRARIGSMTTCAQKRMASLRIRQRVESRKVLPDDF